MYRILERRLTAALRAHLLRAYNLDLPKIVIKQPPKVELGEYATPLVPFGSEVVVIVTAR